MELKVDMKMRFSEELLELIRPIISDEHFLKLKEHRQHLFFTRFEHLIHTAWVSERIARFVWADVKTCVLAGLLHDFHHTRIKNHEHGIMAAHNSSRFDVSEEVLAMVRAHMFPLGFGKVKTPFTKNFLVLKVADFSAATVEVIFGFLSFSWKHGKIRFEKSKEILALCSLL